MMQGMGRNERKGSKGRLLTGWWKGTFGLIVLLGLLIGMMAAQVKSIERERLSERRQGTERLFEMMQGQRSSNLSFRSPTSSFTSRSRQFLPELVWFQTYLTPVSVAFSPDGQFLASPQGSNKVGIFQVSDGYLIRTLTGHTDEVYSVSFSRDGSLIASGSQDRTIKIWRVSDGSLVRTLESHRDWVLSVPFSPDSSLTQVATLKDKAKEAVQVVTDNRHHYLQQKPSQCHCLNPLAKVKPKNTSYRLHYLPCSPLPCLNFFP